MGPIDYIRAAVAYIRDTYRTVQRGTGRCGCGCLPAPDVRVYVSGQQVTDIARAEIKADRARQARMFAAGRKS